MHDHVLPTFAEVCQLVDTDHELNILADDTVDAWLLVDFEVTRLASLNAVNVKLKHCCQLWPKGLRDTVVVEVQHGDFVAIPHYAFKLFVDLDAKQDSLYIKTS